MHSLGRGQDLSLLQTVLRSPFEIWQTFIWEQMYSDIPGTRPSLRFKAWGANLCFPRQRVIFAPRSLCSLPSSAHTSSVHSVHRSCCSRSEPCVWLSTLHPATRGQSREPRLSVKVQGCTCAASRPWPHVTRCNCFGNLSYSILYFRKKVSKHSPFTSACRPWLNSQLSPPHLFSHLASRQDCSRGPGPPLCQQSPSLGTSCPWRFTAECVFQAAGSIWGPRVFLIVGQTFTSPLPCLKSLTQSESPEHRAEFWPVTIM